MIIRRMIVSVLSLLMLIICSYTDLKYRGISRRVLAAFFLLSVVYMSVVCIFKDRSGLLKNCLLYEVKTESVICALIPGLLMLIVSIVTKEAIGKGDVYVILLLGLMTGFDRAFFILLVSMTVCAVFGIVLMIVKGRGRKDTLPYVPFVLGAHILLFVISYQAV